MKYEIEGQQSLYGQDTWSGKTYPAHSVQTEEKTLLPCWKKRHGSPAQTRPLFLCLQRDGRKPDALPEWVQTDRSPSPGEFTTRSFGECPSEERESRLSQILEDCPPRKYYLSARACEGILKRAARRGKNLPEELRLALEAQAQCECAPDVRGGGGKGALVQKEKSGAIGCNNDQMVYCLKGNAVDRDTAQNGRWENKEVSFSLDATDRHGVAVLNGMGGPREGVTENVTGTLRARAKGDGPVVAAGFRHKQSGGAGGIGWQKEAAPTLAAEQLFSVYDARGNGDGKTVPCCTGDHENRVTDYTALRIGNGQTNNATMAEQANTLDTMHDQQAVMACGGGGKMTIRRLTPLECERLQGFPDGWTDIGEWTDSRGRTRKTSDSARYKALGNSIALPFWFWLLRRISAQYERPATLGSLFDGIGGFPLCWERCNGQGTALWVSEIEEFPIAVTKRRLGGGG